VTEWIPESRDAAERAVAGFNVLTGLVPADVDAYAAGVRTQ